MTELKRRTTFPELAEGELRLPDPGEMLVSRDDVYTQFTEDVTLRPGESRITRLNLPVSGRARDLVAYSTVDVSPRSGQAQAGEDIAIEFIDDNGIYVRLMNDGEHNLIYPGKRLIAIGKVYAIGEPLTGDDLLEVLHHIQSPGKELYFENDVPVGINLPLTHYYDHAATAPLDINMLDLPRGSERAALHAMLGLVERPMPEDAVPLHPTQIAGTNWVTLTGKIGLVIGDSVESTGRKRHSRSRAVSTDNNDHSLIAEYKKECPKYMLAGVYHQKVY